MAYHWRDSQAWSSLGLPMSSPSDEACKMFDATLTQLVQHREDEKIGGMGTTISKMLTADPNFVMGHTLVLGMEQQGTGLNPANNTAFQARLENLTKLAALPGTNEREKLHAKALRVHAAGHIEAAVAIWEEVLFNYPLDMMALKFSYMGNIYLGTSVEIRDSVARVIPHYKPDNPYYSYLFGWYGFGLNETNLQNEGEKQARKGLELNPSDSWATHTVAHVMEHQGRQDEAIAFLGSTVKDWSPAEFSACHNYWHKAVFHVEKGDYQGALDIFDEQVGPRVVKNDDLFFLMDATSLLSRLEFEGVNVGERWLDLYKKALPHTDDHNLVFGDAHVLMACLGANQMDTVQKMMDSMNEYIKQGSDTYTDVTKMVGQALCQAFIAYHDGDYAAAVNLLYPKRYLVYRIGGSHAQRDMFNLFLIQACLRSPSAEHNRLARHLLIERKAYKDSAPMTDRLLAKAMAAIL